MSDQSSPPDPLELLKRMWAPMSLPIPGMVVPLANAADVEKRIADLKSVEHWLTLNLNVVKMSIQGLEMQHATLSALQAARQSMEQAAGKASKAASGQAPAGGAGGEAGASDAASQGPLDAWWTLLHQVQSTPEPQSPATPGPHSEPQPGSEGGGRRRKR